MSKQNVSLLIAVLALILSGCAGGEQPVTTGEDFLATATPPPTWTPVTLAPTLPAGTQEIPPSATPEAGAAVTPTAQGPTPLPPPTEIGAATATPAGEGGTGITMTPQMGEPGDTVVVNGTGFPPSSHISLYWADTPDGPLGPLYYEFDADQNGNFEIGLIVLPADRWPGGNPREGDDIWLIARSDQLGDAYRYYVQFLYVARVNPITSLVQVYTNTDYGYEIRLPNRWTWSWVEDNTDDVRFQSPGGVGKGFSLVIRGTDVNAAIQTIMAREFPGQSYTTAAGVAGTVPATRVTASSGRVVLFAPANGRIYVLSFIDENGQVADNIMASFSLTQ